MWLRYVLVPGLTDDENEINHVANYAASLGNVERVELLPFHQMGAFKWERLGMDYTLRDVHPPSQELVNRVKGQFQAAGLNTP